MQHLDRPGFAWEFLRRNPAYQEDYKRIVREDASDASFEGRSRDALVWRWGLAFCGRSKASAAQATVFSRANALPTVVPLAPSPVSFTGARAIDFAELGEAKERAGPDGRHVIIRTDSGELRVRVLDDQVDQPLVLALPLDDDLPIRVKAALRLWARIVRLRGNPGTSPLALTRQRHDRLMLMLRALDGHLADASYREIAQVLIGARRLEHEPWKTSSLRDMTIRLVRGGRSLMQAGYRKLLRGR